MFMIRNLFIKKTTLLLYIYINIYIIVYLTLIEL